MQQENDSKKQAKHFSGKRRLVGLLVTLTVGFSLGFLSHAVFFPDVIPETLFSNAKSISGLDALTADSNTPPTPSPIALMVSVTYKDGEFTPKVAKVHYGNYIAITNKNSTHEDQMWLQSNLEVLNTPRGFAEEERLQTVVLEEGTFTVVNKLKPDAKLTVVVYK